MKPRVNDGVPAYGRVPSRLYVLGERAGKTEYEEGRPFVGDAGKTLREWFCSAGLDFDSCRRWNVCIDYAVGNRKPLPSELERDRPAVEADIASCRPVVIVAVGAFATKWCLKPDLIMREVHGGEFPVHIGGHKAVCVPVYHPSRRSKWRAMGKSDVLAVARVLQGLIS
jgi:uracil-DNA glycosylase family 4